MYERTVKLLFILALLSLNACAMFQQKPEESVRQRINERWALLIEGRLESAYLYETPEYRELNAFSVFRQKYGSTGVWKKADIEKIHCLENKCSAQVRIYVKVKPGLGFDYVETNGLAKENWLRHSATGQWFHLSEQ